MNKTSRKLPLEDWQKDDAARLKALFQAKKAELGLTQERIAAELGENVTQGAVSHFLNARTALSLKAAAVFARVLQVRVSDFSETLAQKMSALGEAAGVNDLQAEEAEAGFSLVPMVSAKAAAGLGYANTHVETRERWPFKDSWLRANRLSSESVVLITADGESMQPTIYDQDQILVDLSAREPVSGQIYVLNSPADGVIVKRLVQTALGSWIICSDNPNKDEYPDLFLRRDDGDDRRIVGKVVWRGGEL